MTKIVPVETQQIHAKRVFELSKEFPCLSSSNNSTLNSATQIPGKSLAALLMYPFKILWRAVIGLGSMISRTLCSFCNTRGSRQILDWQIAKVQFSAIHTAVITSTDFQTNRMKAFQKGLGELSPAARERFYQHIGFALATHETPPITDRHNQEKFYKEKCTPEKIREYLRSVENEVLKEAVREFQLELERKTK